MSPSGSNHALFWAGFCVGGVAAGVATWFVCNQSYERLRKSIGTPSKTSVRFRLVGRVQGVKMRRYIEATGRYFGVAGYCINTSDGNVFGEAHGAPEKMALFVAWLKGFLRQDFTDLKPTPVGCAYPLKARVDIANIEELSPWEAALIPLAKVSEFTMVRDEDAAAALEIDRYEPQRWDLVEAWQWQ